MRNTSYSSLRRVSQKNSGYPENFKLEIGVRIGHPFMHNHFGKECVDVESNYSKLWNEATCDPAVPAEEWPEHAIKASSRIAQHLDDLIAELQVHRDRMLTEAAKLRAEHGLKSKPE